MGRVKRIWYLLPVRAVKVQTSLGIRAVSPEPSLLAHTSSESRETFRQKARSLACLNGWACAVKICNDGMLEDTNSLDGAQIPVKLFRFVESYKKVIIKTKNVSIEPKYDKTNKITSAPFKDSDQPGHLPSLIRGFAVHMKMVLVLSYP